MCGIGGVVRGRGQPDHELVRRMVDTIHYRGPDEDGVTIMGRAGFGHARLSIIDVEHGQQPMTNDEASVMVTFNGEIYNHVELRDELETLGVTFRTRSDTEVLLRAYLYWGEQCVHRFNGEWAFAIWDDRFHRLFASRDRLGIRPLYYAQPRGEFVFASEMKALHVHPGVSATPDLRGLDDIFTFWVPLQGRTFFDGVHQLPPGHCLRYQDGGTETYRFWHYDFTESPGAASEDELVDELEALLTDSVRLRLRSDVPVGTYLSGGLDSSLTTALIARETSNDVQSFSITFDDPLFDESGFQREVSEFIGTRHTAVNCTGSQISAIFPQVVRHAEQPILRSAAAPMYLLSQLASRHGYKAIVTGEGADEVFGGYDIFKEAKIRRYWMDDVTSERRPRLLTRLYPYMPALQAQSLPYLKAFFQVDPSTANSPLFSHRPRWDMTSKLKVFYSDAVVDALRARDPFDDITSELPDDFVGWSHFGQAQYLEMAYLLPGYILSAQGDRMMMANSVEGRFPFLDHRVVEFGMALPARMKMRGLSEKYLLKRLSLGLIPRSVSQRRKVPYRAPDAASFFDDYGTLHHDYVGDALSPQSLAAVGLFDAARVDGLIRKCARGGALGVKDNQAFVGILSTQLLALGS